MSPAPLPAPRRVLLIEDSPDSRESLRLLLEYRGYQVYKNASASQGPAELFTLNLLRGYDLKALGHNSPAYIHTIRDIGYRFEVEAE